MLVELERWLMVLFEDKELVGGGRREKALFVGKLEHFYNLFDSSSRAIFPLKKIRSIQPRSIHKDRLGLIPSRGKYFQ